MMRGKPPAYRRTKLFRPMKTKRKMKLRPNCDRMLHSTSVAAAVTAAARVSAAAVISFMLGRGLNGVAVGALETPAQAFVLDGSLLKWVAALPREGHAEACVRHGFDPTTATVFLRDQLPVLFPKEAAAGTEEPEEGHNIATTSLTSSSTTRTTVVPAAPPPVQHPLWSKALLAQVASGLGLELERPGGVAGCCVPGMWCGARGCYTLAVGSYFSNHGGYVGMPSDEYSVYTCLEPGVPFLSPINSIAPAMNGSNPVIGGSNSSSDDNSNTTAIDVPSTPAPVPAEVGDIDESSPTLPPRPTIVSVSPKVARVGEALMVVGTGFGEEVNAVRVMVGGRDCRDPELCHLVCRPCGDDDRCEFDEICMEDGLSKEKVCLPICDGTEGSCPCDHRCLSKSFELQAKPNSVVVNLCRPPDADPNFLCHGSTLREQERIQCTVPVLAWGQADPEVSTKADGGKTGRGGLKSGGYGGVVEGGLEDGEGGKMSTVSISLSVGGLAAVWGSSDDGGGGSSVVYAPGRCLVDVDCDDGNACSLDACVKGECVFSGVHESFGCQAQPADVTWRGDAYRYFQIVDRADPVEQAEFVEKMQAEHRISSVTAADDYPVEVRNWGTEFPIYGTKYKDIYISPNGALFVPPLQTVVAGELSAVSPSTEAFFPVLKADWNPSDRRASSSVLVIVDEGQFSVLYQDVFLFKRSAEATPSTFSVTVFPDGSLRYRYIRIGDKADWAVGVGGNSFVSPTIRNRHVRQAEFVQMDENGRPAAAASSKLLPVHPPARPGSPISNNSRSASANAYGTGSGGSGSSDISGGVYLSTATTTTSPNDGDTSNGGDDDGGRGGGDGGGGSGGNDFGTEATLCRVPTVACLGRACGKAGIDVPVLWEGFGCQAAASHNVTFACRFGGEVVPAVDTQDVSSSSMMADDGDWAGGWDGERDRKESWGPDWVGGVFSGGGLVCKVPVLEWVEEGQDEAVMVPVEVLWFLPEQASKSAHKQVAHSAADVGIRGLSVMGEAGLANSHVLAFRYYRGDVEAPDCGCSPAPRQTEMTCDSCLVCGGDESSKDCGGFCHGEAHTDLCNQCAGGMTGVTDNLFCDEDGDFDGPTDAALLSLSESIMMLVAISIMTAFLFTCLFVARVLIDREVLAAEGDRHGIIRRRLYSRNRRGLTPSELACVETVEYFTVGEEGGDSFISVAANATTAAAGDNGHGVIGGTAAAVSLLENSRINTNERRVLDEKGSWEGAATAEEAGAAAGVEMVLRGEMMREGLALVTEDQCAICLTEFEGGDVLRKLPCRHLFHQECVDEWLHLSISCPLCKRSAREGLLRRHRMRRRRFPAIATVTAEEQERRANAGSDARATATTVVSSSGRGGWGRREGGWGWRGGLLPPFLQRFFGHNSGDSSRGDGPRPARAQPQQRQRRRQRQWHQIGSSGGDSADEEAEDVLEEETNFSHDRDDGDSVSGDGYGDSDAGYFGPADREGGGVEIHHRRHHHHDDRPAAVAEIRMSAAAHAQLIALVSAGDSSPYRGVSRGSGGGFGGTVRALEAFFYGPSGSSSGGVDVGAGDGGGRLGSRGRREIVGGASVEYELAPIAVSGVREDANRNAEFV